MADINIERGGVAWTTLYQIHEHGDKKYTSEISVTSRADTPEEAVDGLIKAINLCSEEYGLLPFIPDETLPIPETKSKEVKKVEKVEQKEIPGDAEKYKVETIEIRNTQYGKKLVVRGGWFKKFGIPVSFSKAPELSRLELEDRLEEGKSYSPPPELAYAYVKDKHIIGFDSE